MGSVICKVSAYQLGDKTVGRIVGLKTLGDAELVNTVKVVLHPDPAKTEFVQEDAVAEATVTEP